MARRPDHLPDFERPPLVHFVMSVQFESLDVPFLDLVIRGHKAFCRRYPNATEHGHLSHTIETFGKGRTAEQTFALYAGSPMINVRMRTRDKTEMVEFQHDRFTYRWDGAGGHQYPRYEALRNLFMRDLRTFAANVNETGVEELPVTQCEIAYINLLDGAPDESSVVHEKLGEYIRGWHGQVDVPSCELESVNIEMSWTDRAEGRPPARLRAWVAPTFTAAGKHAFQLEVSYRGAPKSADELGILEFFNRGRVRVVNSFTNMTTDNMHEIWGKKK